MPVEPGVLEIIALDFSIYFHALPKRIGKSLESIGGLCCVLSPLCDFINATRWHSCISSLHSRAEQYLVGMPC